MTRDNLFYALFGIGALMVVVAAAFLVVIKMVPEGRAAVPLQIPAPIPAPPADGEPRHPIRAVEPEPQPNAPVTPTAVILPDRHLLEPGRHRLREDEPTELLEAVARDSQP